MLEKMYKIQNRSTSKKSMQKRKPTNFNFNDPNQFILYSAGGGGNQDTQSNVQEVEIAHHIPQSQLTMIDNSSQLQDITQYSR